jgi:hypothetical protein
MIMVDPSYGGSKFDGFFQAHNSMLVGLMFSCRICITVVEQIILARWFSRKWFPFFVVLVNSSKYLTSGFKYIPGYECRFMEEGNDQYN